MNRATPWLELALDHGGTSLARVGTELGHTCPYTPGLPQPAQTWLELALGYDGSPLARVGSELGHYNLHTPVLQQPTQDWLELAMNRANDGPGRLVTAWQ